MNIQMNISCSKYSPQGNIKEQTAIPYVPIIANGNEVKHFFEYFFF